MLPLWSPMLPLQARTPIAVTETTEVTETAGVGTGWGGGGNGVGTAGATHKGGHRGRNGIANFSESTTHPTMHRRGLSAI